MPGDFCTFLLWKLGTALHPETFRAQDSSPIVPGNFRIFSRITRRDHHPVFLRLRLRGQRHEFVPHRLATSATCQKRT